MDFYEYYQSTNIKVSTNISLSFSIKHGKLIQMTGIPIVINIIVLQISQFVVYNMDFLYYTHSYCGLFKRNRGRRGRDCMVVGFTTTYALCSQCLLPLMLWVRISIRAKCTTLCDKVCQSLATSQLFSLGPPVFSTNKTDHHDIT